MPTDSAEEVRARVEGVDRAVRDGDPVPEGDRSINLTSTMRRYKWAIGMRPSPVPKDGLKLLGMQDLTYDKRWVKYFDNRTNEIAIYRSMVGMYWLLRFDPAMAEHWLDHIGTAAKAAERYATDAGG